MDATDRARLKSHLDGGFNELQVHDLLHSDECDVRMGTFIQAAALIDALALAYSGTRKTDYAKKWGRFVERYFPPGYAPVADAYNGFRCLLLHNFSAETLGFTHKELWRHLQTEGGRVILDRGSFVADVVRAFKSFRREALKDDVVGKRILAWLDRHEPVGFWVPQRPLTRSSEMMLQTQALSGTGWTGASYAKNPSLAGMGQLPDHGQRSPDRPRSAPKAATSIKAKPKKSKGH